jgi:hypothetical protein
MTYFTYRRIRGTRGERVFVGSTLIGRVSTVPDWRSRFVLNDAPEIRYRAVGVVGVQLPVAFRSRHDAAEALYEEACRGAPRQPAPHMSTRRRRRSSTGRGRAGGRRGEGAHAG